MGSDSEMPAARLGDIDTGHPPAPPTPIITGSTNTFINGRPVARKGDMLAPHHPGVRLITEGSASVLINGKHAARVSDSINCGGKIITGSSDVLIGNQPGGVRNAVTSAEFSEYIRESMKPQNIGLSQKEEVQLAADIAVKYRGPEGAIATWHDYFMGNEPEAGDLKDPAKKEGFKQAQLEKGIEPPHEDYNPIKPGIAGFDNTTVAGGFINGVLNQAEVVTSKFRSDGLAVQPFTGVEITRPEQQDAVFNNLMGAGGVLKNAAAFTKPLGKFFKGTLHRFEEPARTNTTWDVHKWNVAANHRYSGPGYGATYGSTTPDVALAEVEHYGVASGRVAVAKDVRLNNVLDLTDNNVVEQLGVTKELITRKGDYEITQKIGNWAREEGYDAILAPSAQSNSGSNLIIFPEK